MGDVGSGGSGLEAEGRGGGGEPGELRYLGLIQGDDLNKRSDEGSCTCLEEHTGGIFCLQLRIY